MGRKAKLISMEEFKKKMSPLYDGDYIPCENLPPQVEKDLNKIYFNWENFEHGDDENIGYKTLENGLPVLFCYAGGDWEYPVHFIIYWDGKKLRGYIPEDGNSFDPKFRAAYGSQEDTKLYAQEFGHLKWDDPKRLNACLSPEEIEGTLEDFEKMKKNIINRIEII